MTDALPPPILDLQLPTWFPFQPANHHNKKQNLYANTSNKVKPWTHVDMTERVGVQGESDHTMNLTINTISIPNIIPTNILD